MGQQLHRKNNNVQQKSAYHLYLNLKVHHLSWYNIDLVYSSSSKDGGQPQRIDLKLVMTNYISTPNIEDSKKHMVMMRSFDKSDQNFLPLFTSFEKRIKDILKLEGDMRNLRKNKKRSLYRISKEEYKGKLRELEKSHSQVKKEIKLLLLELFRD